MNVNFSRISLYQACPRKYYWRFVASLVPKREAVPLLIGRAVHEGLASLYSNKDPFEPAYQLIDKELEGELLAEERELLTQQKEVVEQLLRAYMHLAKEDSFTVLAPEVYGHTPLNDKHELFFRTDAVVSWKGHVWLMEHKTTSYTGATFFKRFRMDMQISAYVFAVWRTLKVKPVGVIINALSKKKGTVERDVVTRSDAQLDEFVWTACKVCDIISSTPTDDKREWLCHTSNCVAFNRVCEYVDLCMHDTPGVREGFTQRQADYVDEGFEEE